MTQRKAPLLAILICTLPQRKFFLRNLLENLTHQLTSDVIILVGDDDATITIGEKRNDLVLAAVDEGAEYLCFIDDDDDVSDDYVASILAHLKVWPWPDAVGFHSERTVDGKREKRCIYSAKYHDCGQTRINGELLYRRPIMHLCPVATRLVRQVMFRPVSSGEDTDYGVRLFRKLNAHACPVVPNTIYFYHFRSSKPELPVPRINRTVAK